MTLSVIPQCDQQADQLRLTACQDSLPEPRQADQLSNMRRTRSLEFPEESRKVAIASIRRHVKEELDLDIGDLKASVVLEFVLAELAPSVYNMGVADAKAFFTERTEDLGAFSLEEFTYWPAASRRRS